MDKANEVSIRWELLVVGVVICQVFNFNLIVLGAILYIHNVNRVI